MKVKKRKGTQPKRKVTHPKREGAHPKRKGTHPKREGAHPREPEFRKFLGTGERLESVYTVGVYSALFSNKRVLLKKNLSHSLITFPYSDVEMVEYVTLINWVYLFIATVLFVFAYSFIMLVPPSETITFSLSSSEIVATHGGISGTPLYYHLFGFTCFSFGFWFLFHFILSLFGKLRIELQGDKRQIEIPAKYNDEIPKILGLLERKG